jgi:hypothetical protein
MMMVVVVVMLIVMMMMMMVVMMFMHHWSGRSFLGDRVAGEADRQSGGGDKALDHGQSSVQRPQWSSLSICRESPELTMNRRPA